MSTGSDTFRYASFLFLLLTVLFLSSCAMLPSVPTTSDEKIEHFVRNEARQILGVTEDKDAFPSYQFRLSDFPRKDILGMSIGNRQIYISYELGRQALRNPHYGWLLRQTLAHEIAHDIAGHADQKGDKSFNLSAADSGVTGKDIGLPWYVRLHPYAPQKELEADLRGMQYWKKLHWDCRIWVRIFDAFSKQNYPGDVYHPTNERLKQAVRVCLPESDPERISIETRLAPTRRK